MADAWHEDELDPIAVPTKPRPIGLRDRGPHETIGRALSQENRNVRRQRPGRILFQKAPPRLLIGEIIDAKEALFQPPCWSAAGQNVEPALDAEFVSRSMTGSACGMTTLSIGAP
jgi:hypothetical protein